MRVIIRAGRSLRGSCTVPGDKSISHRAALLGALAEGTTEIDHFLFGDDCRSTLRVLRQLGVPSESEGDRVRIEGVGLHGLHEPEMILDAGNSGTTTRLLLGILAGQDLFAVVTGDESLRRRPMGRVTEPLRAMGASIWGREGGVKAPLAVRGAGQLRPIDWTMKVASAQVKSALLLAGLYADGVTTVRQPVLSRDHTERMLRSFGVEVKVDGLNVSLRGGATLRGRPLVVPGDISAAAFLMVGASLTPDSEIVIREVGVNPTRTGLIDIMREMGANIELINTRWLGGEPVADIVVRSARLHGVKIGGETIPRLVDEIPVLAVAGACAAGVTEISGAAELRVKESDRLQAVSELLGRLGASIAEKPDGLIIQGGRPLTGVLADSLNDHRMAMSLAVAGLTAAGETEVDHFECVAVSFPNFLDTLSGLGADIAVVR